MNNRDFYKDIMSNVQPSDESVERILDMTKESKKRIKPVPALAIVACLALFVTGVASANSFAKKESPVTTPSSNAITQSNNIFTITAYAGEGDEKTPILLDKDNIVLQDTKLRRSRDSDNKPQLHQSGESSFSVAGENIKSVTYSCKNGTIGFIVDINKVQYLKSKGEYFDVIIPYLDEYKNANGVSEWDVFAEHFQKGEYDKYFTNTEKKSIDDYWQAEYIYTDDDSEITGVGVVSKATWETVFDTGELKEYTFENYFNTNKSFADAFWELDDSELDKLIKNDNMGFDEVQHDTLTISVHFNDGSTQEINYDLGFNKNGNLVITEIKQN